MSHTLSPVDPTLIALEQTRLIRAPRLEVYRAWTDPEIVKKWFGPPNRFVSHADFDPRVGGTYRIEMSLRPDPAKPEAPAAIPVTVTGTYTQVVPNELLQFTWIAGWSQDEESLVTVTLRDVDGGTEILLRHDKFLSEPSRDAHHNGWAEGLNNFARVLEN